MAFDAIEPLLSSGTKGVQNSMYGQWTAIYVAQWRSAIGVLSIPARGSLHEGLEVYVIFIATAAGNTTQQAAIFPFPFSGCQAVSARERFWPIILFLTATLNI